MEKLPNLRIIFYLILAVPEVILVETYIECNDPNGDRITTALREQCLQDETNNYNSDSSAVKIGDSININETPSSTTPSSTTALNINAVQTSVQSEIKVENEECTDEIPVDVDNDTLDVTPEYITEPYFLDAHLDEYEDYVEKYTYNDTISITTEDSILENNTRTLDATNVKGVSLENKDSNHTIKPESDSLLVVNKNNLGLKNESQLKQILPNIQDSDKHIYTSPNMTNLVKSVILGRKRDDNFSEGKNSLMTKLYENNTRDFTSKQINSIKEEFRGKLDKVKDETRDLELMSRNKFLITPSRLIAVDPLLADKNKKEMNKILYQAEVEMRATLINGSTDMDSNEFTENDPNSLNGKRKHRFRFGVLSEFCDDCDLGILPIGAAALKERPQDLSGTIPEVSIQFADVPAGDEFQVDKLDLSEGIFIFHFLGDFLSWLQPNDFPVELIRDVLKNRITVFDLITQSLKLEAGFVTCLVVGILLALAAPIVVLSHTCYRLRSRSRDNNNLEEGPTWAGNCRRRSFVLILQIIIVLLLLGIVGMIVTNQQVSNAMHEIGHVVNVVFNDLNTYLGNTNLQLHFVVTKHLEQVVQKADSDLNNAEALLGRPIQQELSRETGIDVALDSLRNIAQDASKIGELVELVQLAAGLVAESVLITRDKLSDLRLQVDSFRRQCAPRDRPLCDTISIAGLDISLRVDTLRRDDKLKRVRQIGGPELRSAVEAARLMYLDIPRQVDSDTRTFRQDATRHLYQQQTQIDQSVRVVDTLIRNIRSKVLVSQSLVNDIARSIPDMEFLRWSTSLGAAGLVLLVWIFLQSAISCGCCGSEKSATSMLLLCVVLICLVSTALWIVALIVFLIGGHGEAFLCRPLYQEPDFLALSELLDKSGLLPGSRSFLSSLTYNNETMDVPVSNILRECRTNNAAYPTFQLKGILNADLISEFKEWESFPTKLNKSGVKLDHVNVLAPNLYTQLDDLLQGLSVNLTAHRLQLSEPIMGKDLNAFAAQLDSVGNQLKDLASASRMETLATRTRRLIATHIDPLKEKKEKLVYQLTALEVHLGPLQHQVEQSISHLKTIQFYIKSQGNKIAEKKTADYTNRLASYINQYRSHLNEVLSSDIAKCQPVWNMFHASRVTLCKHVMDPLNGFWFFVIYCLVLLLFATPISLKLVDHYRQIKRSGISTLTGNCDSSSGGW